MENLITHTNYKITSADTDMHARLRPGAMLNILIQSAIASADNLGFGFKDLKKHKKFWVLSRISIEIKRCLVWNEEVTVETWPKDVDRFLYLRDFLVRDKQNTIVAKATSGWLAIDIDSKRPGRIEGIKADWFDRLKHKNALLKKPEKLNGITDGQITEIRSSYFDIDLNKHVTATRYVDWMMDTLPLEYHERFYPFEISVNYLKETMPYETIQLQRNEYNGNNFIFEGLNKHSKTVAFRGAIQFEDVG